MNNHDVDTQKHITNKNSSDIHHYGSEFNVSSAEEIVPYIIEILKPTSVIDVGCGLGTWLNVYLKYGIRQVRGIDGPHIMKYNLFVDPGLISIGDLEEIAVFSTERFNLCQCLEVAEHIHENHARDFIEKLTLLSDYIVFSAAIPGQTGENHFNEQPQAYWVRLFEQFGYFCYDVFREKFWNNPKVEWWYKQNMFLFVKGNESYNNLKRYKWNEYIHPELFIRYTNARLPVDGGVRQRIPAFLRRLLHRISMRLSRLK